MAVLVRCKVCGRVDHYAVVAEHVEATHGDPAIFIDYPYGTDDGGPPQTANGDPYIPNLGRRPIS